VVDRRTLDLKVVASGEQVVGSDRAVSSVTRVDAIESSVVETPGYSYGTVPTKVTSIPVRGFPEPSSIVALREPDGARATSSVVAAVVLAVEKTCWSMWVSAGERTVISTGPGARSVHGVGAVGCGRDRPTGAELVAVHRRPDDRLTGIGVGDHATDRGGAGERQVLAGIDVVPTTVSDAVTSPNPGARAVTV